MVDNAFSINFHPEANHDYIYTAPDKEVYIYQNVPLECLGTTNYLYYYTQY